MLRCFTSLFRTLLQADIFEILCTDTILKLLHIFFFQCKFWKKKPDLFSLITNESTKNVFVKHYVPNYMLGPTNLPSFKALAQIKVFCSQEKHEECMNRWMDRQMTHKAICPSNLRIWGHYEYINQFRSNFRFLLNKKCRRSLVWIHSLYRKFRLL